MATKTVPFPEFELVGPKCSTTDCDGVLIDTMSIKTGRLFKQCFVCKKTVYRSDMSDLAAGCPDCKNYLEDIAALEAKITALEARCENTRVGKKCMLKPNHSGCHRYWEDFTATSWGGG